LSRKEGNEGEGIHGSKGSMFQLCKRWIFSGDLVKVGVDSNNVLYIWKEM
jgi:hypothetical protein